MIMKIKKISQVSTKSGDNGYSYAYSGEKLSKGDILFEVLGDIDELSSFLGLCYHYIQSETLPIIQKLLQNMASMVATSFEHPNYSKLTKITDNDLLWLEEESTKIIRSSNIETGFALPGSDTSLSGAYLDVCRTVTRRTERIMARYLFENKRKDLDICLKFINRLSDYLFIFARSEKDR